MPLLFDHIDLRVSDLASVESFYRTLLPALGFIRDQKLDDWIQYEDEPGAQFFGVTCSPGHVANENRIAFQAASVAEVDRVAEIAREAGALNMEGPMLYGGGHHVFFEDPCGNRLEVCFRPPPVESL